MDKRESVHVSPKIIGELALNRSLPPVEREWMRRRGCISPVTVALKMNRLSFGLQLWFWFSLFATVILMVTLAVTKSAGLIDDELIKSYARSDFSFLVISVVLILSIQALRLFNWEERRLVREFCADLEEFYVWSGKPAPIKFFLSAHKHAGINLAEAILMEVGMRAQRKLAELEHHRSLLTMTESNKLEVLEAEYRRIDAELQHKYDVLRDLDLALRGGHEQYYKKAKRAA